MSATQKENPPMGATMAGLINNETETAIVARATQKNREKIMIKDASSKVIEAETGFVWGMVSSLTSLVHKQVTGTWADLCSMVTTHTVSPSKDGAGWLPALIEPGKRNNARAGAWCVMVLDIEAPTNGDKDGLKTVIGELAPSLDAVATELDLRGWSACLATSHSHEGPATNGTLGPRYRIVFEVSRPVLPGEVEPLAWELAAMLGLAECLDAKCFDASRLFFLPRCPDDRKELSERAIVQGAPIDVDAILSQAKAAVTPPRKEVKQGATGDVIGKFNQAYTCGQILERNGYKPCGRDRWIGPNSSSNMPGIHKLPDVERVFSHHGTTDKLTGEHGHDAFSLFTVLEHYDNTKAAARAAAKELGIKATRPAAPKVDLSGLLVKVAQSGAAAGPECKHPDDDDIELPFATEMQMSELLTQKSLGLLRWTDGLDWLANIGTHWIRDLSLTRYTKAKAVCRETAAAIDNPKLQSKICAASTTNAILSLSRSDAGIVTPVEEWDKHPMVLNTRGEAIDLETGKPVSRDGLLFMQVAGAAPGAMKTPVWEKFITEVFDGDLETIEFMQRMAGYCLTGSTIEQKIFFLHGSGSNGKSVFLDVLQSIAGAYGHALPSTALMTQKHEGHRQRLASLMGKRIAISSEIEESAHWAEAQLKELTGDKTLTANFMRQNDFTFTVTHKHLLAGNSKPRLKGDDFAMARRMILVPFTQKFEGVNRDNKLPAKLKQEYPGILQWCIDGAVKWAASGLAIPESVTTASREYMAENNDLDLWLDACCTRVPGFQCPSAEAYASFSHFKASQGEHPGVHKNFSQRLERMFEKKRLKTGIVFEGFKVNFVTDFQSDYAKASQGE